MNIRLYRTLFHFPLVCFEIENSARRGPPRHKR